MPGHPIRRAVAVMAAAALTTALASSALAADPEVAAKKRVVKCAGVVATKVGTPGPDRLVGTPKRDIIAGLGGNDVIFGLGGNDLICGGSGNDRLSGGPGRDKVLGQTGRDKVLGGTGLDRLFGGAHNDALFGQGQPDFLFGGTGADKLVGGAGTDTCYQGPGGGALVSCELPLVVVIPPPPLPPPPPTLHDLTGVLAIAYSDIDGLDGYSTGDKLIAKLVDTNGDKVPSTTAPADTVVMGTFPVDFAATTFGTWGVTSHKVTHVSDALSSRVQVDNPSDSFVWATFGNPYLPSTEYYYEWSSYSSWVIDRLSTSDDEILMTASPSAPDPTTALKENTSHRDDRFIDVEILCCGP